MPVLDFDTDSEDGDYTPPAVNHNSDSDSDSNHDPETAPKRVKLSDPDIPVQTEEEKTRTREAVWASFQATTATDRSEPAPPAAMVKVEKRYKFAGEEVIEVMEVPEDSKDAQIWPRITASLPTAANFAASSSLLPPHQASSTTTRNRRKGLGLPDIPSHPKSNTKKLNTLDKSAMDWRAHITSSGSMDELSANKKSGNGYLDKVGFLDRVHNRKEELLEVSKGTKRRRT